MVPPMRALVLLVPIALLAACGDDTRTAGGVTKAEAEALDEAAEIIEQQRLPAEAVGPAAAEPSAPAASDAPKPGG